MQYDGVIHLCTLKKKADDMDIGWLKFLFPLQIQVDSWFQLELGV